MKKLLMLSVIFMAAGCNSTNDDGSSKWTYSSCNVTSSQAVSATDRARDQAQCWNFDGVGIYIKSDALAQCKTKVQNYVIGQYGSITHKVNYEVVSHKCK
ncbi:hypothetical protein [Thaumasiovibrio subtropicus]|uniref:hypothetical protein n=1 Tax=Thaumasiovibrio subtropicus TaxID=1891207 RepID=UPI000B34DF56|nr:hypothetical protein [Thaumasiovibrio subtropicus]